MDSLFCENFKSERNQNSEIFVYKIIRQIEVGSVLLLTFTIFFAFCDILRFFLLNSCPQLVGTPGMKG